MSYTFRIKVDLVKYLAIDTTTTQTIDFSITNNENFVSTYESAYGLSFTKTSSLSSTNAVVYAGGGSSTKIGNQVLSLSATNDYIIFDGTFNDTYFDEFMFFVINNVFILDVDGKTNLLLFKQNSENDQLSKTLTYVDMIQGKFNHAIGLKNINIDIYNYQNNFNYVFIPSLKRYYYVDSIEIISADITRLHLKEDVLMSWKTLILNQSALVTRYQASTETNLSDPRLPIDNIVSVSYVTPSNVSSGSMVNTTLSANPSGNNILVSTLASNDVAVTKTNVSSPTGSALPSIGGIYTNLEHVYFITKAEYDLLYYADYHDSETSSFVNTIMWLPFNPQTPFAYQLNSSYISPIHANDKYLYNDEIPSTRWVTNDSGHTPDILAYESKLGASPYIVIKDFNFTSSSGLSFFGNFLDYEPYSIWEIYIPFVGWQQVAYKDVENSRIIIYYSMDIHTGRATAYIYNVTKSKLIWSGSCEIGIQLAITNSNALELQKQQQANQLNMIMSLVGSAVSVGVGVAKKSPVAIAGGIMSGAKGIASAVNSEMMMIDRAVTSFGSSDACLHSPLSVVVRCTYHEELLDSTALAKYKHMNGLPFNKYVALSSLTTGNYIEVGTIHFDPMNEIIYQDEISEIVELLQNGVII